MKKEKPEKGTKTERHNMCFFSFASFGHRCRQDNEIDRTTAELNGIDPLAADVTGSKQPADSFFFLNQRVGYGLNEQVRAKVIISNIQYCGKIT